ncbi:MAG: N-acetyltransferase [Phototrophicales bacterium]|nr:MAG: N-acetyltransferase [Phototrophicales bacterium]
MSDIASLDAMLVALGFHKDPEYFSQCLAEQAQGRREVYIASLAGGDVGYAMLNWFPGYAPFRRLGIPEIQDINTIPAARRQGVATALIRYCEDLARERGCTEMGIGVGLHAGFGNAQRLYARLGYVPDGAGAVYDRGPVRAGELRPIDDNLCLMLLKLL